MTAPATSPHLSAAVVTQQAHIEAALRALADAQQAVPMRAYMLNQFDFLGIRAKPRRSALRGLPRLSGWAADELLALAEALWALPEREFQYVAVDLLASQVRRLSPNYLPRLLGLVQCKSWWDTVDGLAGVIGDVLLHARAGRPDVQQTMDAWLTDADKWVRRVAVLHQLGWRAQTDEERLFRYALVLAPETDFFIRKAVGWALRDYARSAPDRVRHFLAAHGGALSGLTRREAGKHLT